MPDDSYVLKYLQFLGKFLSVGPPVLFVLNNTGKFRCLIQDMFYSNNFICIPIASLSHLVKFQSF